LEGDLGLRGRTTWTLAIGLCAVALCGCGGGSHAATTIPAGKQSGTVDIYASLPRSGPATGQSQAFLNGANLELTERNHAAGFFDVNFVPLNDANASGIWNPTLVAANALKAADDARAIYYIGDWSSGANEISIPILNQAGVPQVSPASNFAGLSTGPPGPSGTRTFLRLVPPASVEAAADVEALKQLHCGAVALAHDSPGSDLDGSGIADALRGLRGAGIVSDSPVDPSSPNFPGWLASLKHLGVNCVLYAGDVADGGARVVAAVDRQFPTMKILGTDGVCTSAWAALLPRSGDSDSHLYCTSPTPKLSATPTGAQFLAAYKGQYGVSNPDPYAVYGYEAMKLGLDAIESLGSNGDIKADVVKALFATRGRSSPIGTYSFNRNGDISLDSYGLYRFERGAPTFALSLPASR
jgi:branched-chain amino acid transport system substrate-binding protein